MATQTPGGPTKGGPGSPRLESPGLFESDSLRRTVKALREELAEAIRRLDAAERRLVAARRGAELAREEARTAWLEVEVVRQAGARFMGDVHRRFHDPDKDCKHCRLPLCGEGRRIFLAPAGGTGGTKGATERE